MSSKTVIVVTPHPDDETIGCGGTLLSLKKMGYSVNWLIVTSVYEKDGYSCDRVRTRDDEIKKVELEYDFDSVIKIGISTTKVDELSKGELVSKISKAFNEVKPNIVFTPFINDVHTDHKLISEAVISCSKWFRYPFIEKILYYETVSETDFNIDPSNRIFFPNVYIDISLYLDRKIEIMKIYESELSEFPFPRSEKVIKSLAYLRGSQSGFEAAEAFQLLRANIKV